MKRGGKENVEVKCDCSSVQSGTISKRCIDSILGQNYKNIELILVDDGSPDACPGICDQYQEKDERVIVFHQQNSGVAVARNSGMRIATGDYITFVDSDDYIGKEMYSSMLKRLNNISVMLRCVIA